MAYALQSLITILQKILNPQQTLWCVDHNKPQLESLLQKSTSLQQILDESPLTKIEFLESQIRDAAHEAEDIIESHMVDQMLSNPEAVGLTFSTPDLQPLMQQLDSAMKQVGKLVEGKTGPSSGTSFSPNVDSVRSKALVGVDGDLKQLRDWLIGDMSKQLEIMPIVGMGGIGKTTIARKLYEDPSIVSHFDAHAWATVSQDYDMKAILLSLLHCIRGNKYEYHAGKEINELQLNLFQSLIGRRYMIVLDDVWSSKFWHEISMYFPRNNERSRIVITTRESEVAKHASSQSVQHQMQLLDKFESWKLLCQEVFGDQDCPLFLQGIGEKISRDCGGLPLAINVIGRLLSKVERSKGVWESIAKNVVSAIVEADEQFSDILSLSYSHLPNHLKACFLYMGACLEDRIDSSKLVRMWMAEGFVKSNGNRSLEEEAEGCLKALVERNLIFVSEYEYAKPKYYGMHDLLRDLCIWKSNEEKFVYVGNGRVSNPRRMCVADESFEDNVTEECIPLVRSFITTGEILEEILVNLYLFRLVRVLDVMNVKFEEFPMEILQLVNLRFLAVWCYSGGIPSGISRLKNLQTLIAEMFVDSCAFTSEIFEMSELRHFQLTERRGIDQDLHLIEIDEKDMKSIAPNKLQTLSRIRITESLIKRGFLESIPEIKDLALRCMYDDLTPGAVDLTHLHKLETLTIHPNKWGMEDRLSIFAFPSGLRKLVVHDHVMFPTVMRTLCALPHLEVLRMHRCEFAREGDDNDEEWEVAKGDKFAREGDDDDEEWEVVEGDEFRSLQVLYIQFSELVRWRADETNFPRLRHLHLYACPLLEVIPSGIGEIPTLELIELRYCSDSAVASARQIVEEQQSDYGNDTLQLSVHGIEQQSATKIVEEQQSDYGNYTLQLSKHGIEQQSATKVVEEQQFDYVNYTLQLSVHRIKQASATKILEEQQSDYDKLSGIKQKY